ncbi:MAG: mechanosensitive ion channel domain-containing protein, partial [Dongiaceae bacterium]
AVIALASWTVLVGLRRAFERGFALGPELRLRFPGLEARVNRYLPLLRGLLQAFVYLMAGLVLLEAWGLQTLDWLASDLGRRLTGGALTIAVVLVFAALLSELAGALIERYLERRDVAGRVVARSGRARTLLPLLRNALRLVLGVIVVLVALSEIGLDIGPLLAAAGVVGLAVGFGAQTLVKDVITGVFILAEDSIAVGDVVDVGGHAGVVEGLTIRTLRLRDLAGSVHTVPFSEVTTVKNLTKDFSYAVMDIGVAYREDVDAVIATLKEIAAAMQADAAFGPEILEPMEVLGLDSFGDSAVVIKARIKTRPVKQWMVMREFNRRMKRVFDEKGIEIPFPHQTIYFGEDKAGRAPPLRARVEPPPPGEERG